MPDKKLTDSEIVKALECCANNTNDSVCYENKCPLFGQKCIDILSKNALDLINRQKAEIENLGIELKAMRGVSNSYKAKVKRLNESKSTIAKLPLMTTKDDEIYSGVVHCLEKFCMHCPYEEDEHCETTLKRDVLELLDRKDNIIGSVLEVSAIIYKNSEKGYKEDIDCFADKLKGVLPSWLHPVVDISVKEMIDQSPISEE